MTVSSTSSRVVLLGNGTNTLWIFAFKVQQPADLVVVYTDATGSDITLSAGQYDATGFGQDNGGTVTYPKSGSGNPAIAHGTTLTIYRRVAVTQPTSISNQGAMWPQVIEAALDRLTYIGQAVTDAISRSLVISPTDGDSLGVLPTRTLRKNSLLGFDGAGQPYAAQGFTGSAAASSWMVSTFLPANSAPTARGILSAAGIGDNNAFTGTNTFATQAAADNSTKAASTAYADRAAANAISTVVLRSYLAGLGLSNNGTTPNTKLDVAAGVCADSTNALMLNVAGGTINCATTGANGLDTGSLANTTVYHAYAIGKTDGTTALVASTSASAPSPMPTGYTLKRRIGSFITDSSAHIRVFTQVGDRFKWSSSTAIAAAAPTAGSDIDRVLDVPTGIVVEAWVRTYAFSADGANTLTLLSAKTETAVAPSTSAWPLADHEVTAAGSGPSIGAMNDKYVFTNTSATIRSRSTGSTTNYTLYIATLGWLDRRGRDS